MDEPMEFFFQLIFFILLVVVAGEIIYCGVVICRDLPNNFLMTVRIIIIGYC
jgi:hypothetical protein